MLDVLVRTLGREAKRFEKTSQRRRLFPEELDQVISLAGAVGKVAEQIHNPFSPVYQARLRRMNDEQLEAHARELNAIEATTV